MSRLASCLSGRIMILCLVDVVAICPVKESGKVFCGCVIVHPQNAACHQVLGTLGLYLHPEVCVHRVASVLSLVLFRCCVPCNSLEFKLGHAHDKANPLCNSTEAQAAAYAVCCCFVHRHKVVWLKFASLVLSSGLRQVSSKAMVQ